MKLSIKLLWGVKDTKKSVIYDCSRLKYVFDRFRDWLMLQKVSWKQKTRFSWALEKVCAPTYTDTKYLRYLSKNHFIYFSNI